MTTVIRKLSAYFTARPGLQKCITVVLALGVVAGVGKAVLPLLETFALIASSADSLLLTLAVLVFLIYRLAHAAMWKWILAAVGPSISFPSAARMWIWSEACRWLPGSVWGLGSRVVLGGRLGISAIVVGAGISLELALTVVSWGVIGLTGAAMSDGQINIPFVLPMDWIVGVGPCIAVAALWIASKHGSKIREKISHAIGRFRLLSQVRLRRNLAAAVLLAFVVFCLLNGMTCWLVIRALAPAYDIPLSTVITANALAWLAGFFAVFAPAGLGVREGAFILLISPWIPWEYATVSAAFIRLAQIAVELTCLGLVSINKSIASANHSWRNNFHARQAVNAFSAPTLVKLSSSK